MDTTDLLVQLELPTEHTRETLHIKDIKERLAANPDEKGDRLCITFKLSRDRHGELLHAVVKHGLTVTDVLRDYIDRIIPVLQRAKPVEVPAYKVDHRTKLPQHRRAG